MAKYDVTHKCGHKREVQQFGKETDRTRKREWMATQLCPNCQKDKDLEDARVFAFEQHLPAFVSGSEAQQNWAQRIRHTFLVDAMSYIDREKPDEMTKTYFNKALELVRTQQDSRWWIDKKDSFGSSVVLEKAREMYLKDDAAKGQS